MIQEGTDVINLKDITVINSRQHGIYLKTQTEQVQLQDIKAQGKIYIYRCMLIILLKTRMSNNCNILGAILLPTLVYILII